MSEIRIGVIGMAVMGRSLALNMADHGFKVAIYNRSKEPLELAVKEDQTGNLIPAENMQAFVESLAKPRNILLMVKSGAPVDGMIDQLLPYLEEGDLIIDGGNSYFKDTIRRANELEAKGLHFFGMGVSGGEEGARRGPAMMPGGDKLAYERVKDILESISAKAKNGEACCKYTSTDGAGHYVKMVHNGIEYADMQIIAEGYAIMKDVLSLDNDEMSAIFDQFNHGRLNSYLIEITRYILAEKDDLAEGYLIDKIVDGAEQKGTGKWTNLEGVDLGVDTSILLAGLNSRIISSLREERKYASSKLQYFATLPVIDKKAILKDLEDALLACKIMAYAQGFYLYKVAAKAYGWEFDYQKIASIFRAGCIIRSSLLYDIMDEFGKDNDLVNLMVSESFSKILNEVTPGLRRIVKLAVDAGIGIPAMMAALSYFDSYRREFSTANMIQAQRDYFGAHTYERIDREGYFHHQWVK